MTMNLSGSLGAFGLDEVLSMLGLGGRTARMQVTSSQGIGSVHLVDGHVSAANQRVGRAGLLRRLVAESTVPADDLVAVLDQDEPVVALVEGGVVSRDTAHRVAVDHIVDALGEMLAWRDGEFAVWSGEADPADIGVRLPIAEAIDRGRARVQDWARVNGALPEPHTVLSIDPLVVEGPSLSIGEWSVLARIDGQRTLAEVIAGAGAAPLHASERILALMGRGLVRVRAEQVAEPDRIAALIESFEGGASAEDLEPGAGAVSLMADPDPQAHPEAVPSVAEAPGVLVESGSIPLVPAGEPEAVVMVQAEAEAAAIVMVEADAEAGAVVTVEPEMAVMPEPEAVVAPEPEAEAAMAVTVEPEAEAVMVEAGPAIDDHPEHVAVPGIDGEPEQMELVEPVPVLVEDPAPVPPSPWIGVRPPEPAPDPAVTAWLESATPAEELMALVGQVPVEAVVPSEAMASADALASASPGLPSDAAAEQIGDATYDLPAEVGSVGWAPVADSPALAPGAPDPAVSSAVEWSPWAQALGLGAPAPEGELVVDPLAGPGIAQMIAGAHLLADAAEVPVPPVPLLPGTGGLAEAGDLPVPRDAVGQARSAQASLSPAGDGEARPEAQAVPIVAPVASPAREGLLSDLMSGVRGD